MNEVEREELALLRARVTRLQRENARLEATLDDLNCRNDNTFLKEWGHQGPDCVYGLAA